MKIKAPRGTHDILPAQSHAWQYAENLFQKIVWQYGYQEIRTPMFEDTELFLRSAGDTSEVVTKQMYSFKDKGDRDITLKAEGTAPAVRAYLEHNLGEQGTMTRLWYRTPVFRYERPQTGRYRQHHQLGIECLGSSSPLADAEVIEIAMRFYRELGLENLSVSLNSIGKAQTRAAYREALLKHGHAYLSDLGEEDRQKAEKNPLRLLDSKDPKAIEAFSDAPSIQDFLEDVSKIHADVLQSALLSAGIPFTVNPSIVRGLDYYNDTVFEILSGEIGSQSAICGGGRYDGLVKEFGGTATPAVGFGMGIERMLLVLEATGKIVPSPTPDAYLVAATDSARMPLISLARNLRQQGFSVGMDLDGKNLKAQFKAADRSNARFAIVLGDDEIASRTVSLRDLQASQQTTIKMEDLPNALR
jgi:histidyl-tRNA synthetase